jgi:serine/threonine-protein kinase RsbW
MMPSGHLIVRLEFTSAFDQLDLVQLVGDHVTRRVGLDEDARYSVGVAIRESVINAIRHGNGNDETKRVVVDFLTDGSSGVAAAGAGDTFGGDVLLIRVRDQGHGFDPTTVANPLAPENLLKASGRGIFLIRNFMDEVQIERAPDGGTEICMIKRIQPSGTPSGPVRS